MKELTYEQTAEKLFEFLTNEELLEKVLFYRAFQIANEKVIGVIVMQSTLSGPLPKEQWDEFFSKFTGGDSRADVLNTIQEMTGTDSKGLLTKTVVANLGEDAPPAKALKIMFSFTATPEGDEYWHNIHDKWLEFSGLTEDSNEESSEEE